MATYISALGTFAGQLTVSFRRGRAVAPALPRREPRGSFFRSLLGALAAWPC
jgi:hypothetical protein